MNDSRCNWFADAGFGLFVHWTSRTVNKKGQVKSYQEAVRDFQIDQFVNQVVESGARFVFFTITHGEMKVPFPLPELDAIVTRHTCERDLMSELSDKLERNGIKLMFYFNGDGGGSMGHGDIEWQQATGSYTNLKRHAEICYHIVEAISHRYGKKVHGWWIDTCYEQPVSDRGAHYNFRRYADALRAGNPDSLVAFNFRGTFPWHSELGREISDFQAGEENDLWRVPSGQFSGEGGTQWFAVCPMDDFWSHSSIGQPEPVYTNETVLKYIRHVQKNRGVFAYNVAPYQEGTISEKTMNQLRWLNRKMSNT